MFQNWRDVNKNQVLLILKKLEALFTDRDTWIFWPIAENNRGIEVKPTDPSATKFSLMGASELYTTQIYKKPLADYVDCALREYLNELSGEDLIRSKCGYEEEIMLIRMAIQEVEK